MAFEVIRDVPGPIASWELNRSGILSCVVQKRSSNTSAEDSNELTFDSSVVSSEKKDFFL